MGSDLGALVIDVRCGLDTRIPHHMGRALQHICLRAVEETNPALSKKLHDGHGTKGYAVSGLLQPNSRPVDGMVYKNAPAWVRLVGLQPAVVDCLQSYVNTQPEAIMIDHRPWYVDKMYWEGEWANTTTYSELIQKYQGDRPRKYIKMRFVTPTSFHSKGHNMPFPLPFLVFQSLIMRWEALSDVPLPEDLLAFVEHFVMVSRYKGETEMLTFKEKSMQVGFVGEVEFTIANQNPKFKRKDPQTHHRLKVRHSEYALMLNMLTEFAFFGGVGIKTTSGMGMVKPI